MNTFRAEACFRCFFLIDPILNFGFDFFKFLSMYFKLQPMLFFQLVEDIGVDSLGEFIGFHVVIVRYPLLIDSLTYCLLWTGFLSVPA